jgi:hypothetical protein
LKPFIGLLEGEGIFVLVKVFEIDWKGDLPKFLRFIGRLLFFLWKAVRRGSLIF